MKTIYETFDITQTFGHFDGFDYARSFAKYTGSEIVKSETAVLRKVAFFRGGTAYVCIGRIGDKVPRPILPNPKFVIENEVTA